MCTIITIISPEIKHLTELLPSAIEVWYSSICFVQYYSEVTWDGNFLWRRCAIFMEKFRATYWTGPWDKTRRIPWATYNGMHMDAKTSTTSILIARFMGPTWGRQVPGGPHVGPMNLSIWVAMHNRDVIYQLKSGIITRNLWIHYNSIPRREWMN